MKIYVEQLANVDPKALFFMGLDVENGWYKATNDCYGKVVIEDLPANDPRSALYAGEEDVVLETDDELSSAYSFENLSEVRQFVDNVFKLMENVHDTSN